jgi:predicted ArsR family transcriptional regulator
VTVDLPTAAAGDPLAQPTAIRLFEVLTAARRPLTTADAAERAGVHPNSARLHLGRLAAAGIAEEGTDPGARGRPRKTWRVANGGRIGGRPPDANRELAQWLSRSVAVMAADRAEIRAQGRMIGREIAAEAESDDCPAVLDDSLRAMGFWPRREQEGSTTRFTLCNCPYRDVAESNLEVICTLHLGIAEGIVHGADRRARVTDFEARDPKTAGCRIEIEAPIEGNEESR